MILIGGVDNKDTYLSDSYELDLETLVCSSLKISYETMLFPIAYHSLCFVNKFQEFRMNSLYMPYDIKKSQVFYY